MGSYLKINQIVSFPAGTTGTLLVQNYSTTIVPRHGQVQKKCTVFRDTRRCGQRIWGHKAKPRTLIRKRKVVKNVVYISTDYLLSIGDNGTTR